jgi:diguanylate cyclase (GGDEF)-like protein
MRILIAENDQIARHLLEITLGKLGYDVFSVCDGTSACRLLQSTDAPRLVTLGWTLAGMDGLELCREIRRMKGRAYTYVLLMVPNEVREHLMEGLEAGADDYLVKPLDPHELSARLNVAMRTLELQDQFLSICEELRTRASRDSLTNLWNHAAILEILDQELARAKREQKPLGVIMADLDHFKRINDTHGHLAGDAVLQLAARNLQAALRPSDAIGRYGGEEFLIVLPGCDVPSLARLSERLRESIALSPIISSKYSISLTISIGSASNPAGIVTDGTTLLHAADGALYRAKRNGRNRVEFSPLLSARSSASGPLRGVSHRARCQESIVPG